jgi:hypothetical protein
VFDCFALRFVNETHDSSAGTGASSSSTSMHIRFAVFWGVKMKHTFDTINVNTSGSYIGGNENQRFTVSEMG